jgi:hypothetical protein
MGHQTIYEISDPDQKITCTENACSLPLLRTPYHKARTFLTKHIFSDLCTRMHARDLEAQRQHYLMRIKYTPGLLAGWNKTLMKWTG